MANKVSSSTPFHLLLLLLTALHLTSCLAQAPGGAGTSAGGGGSGVGGSGSKGDSVIELYMHDVLGGTNPTARPITGLLGNIYNGQVPFARPIGFMPPKNGVIIPNADGALPSLNANNGIPLGAGLSGTAVLQTSKGPLSTGRVQTQLGPDGLSLGFGTITVIDDVMTVGPDLGSQPIAKAQGLYMATSGATQMMAFTVMMESGEFGDTLNLFGVYKVGAAVSRLSVSGGTGKFKGAGGMAEIRPLFPSGQHAIDGVETLLRITIHVTY